MTDLAGAASRFHALSEKHGISLDAVMILDAIHDPVIEGDAGYFRERLAAYGCREETLAMRDAYLRLDRRIVRIARHIDGDD